MRALLPLGMMVLGSIAGWDDDGGWTLLELLTLACAPVCIEGWVRIKVARIEAWASLQAPDSGD